MIRSLSAIAFFFLFYSDSFSQDKIAELDVAARFQKGNNAGGYYISNKPGYVVNLQTFGQISRALYDSNYQLLTSYSLKTNEITFNNTSATFAPVFATELQLSSGIYEIYSSLRKIVLIAPDFDKKQDSLVYSLDLKQHERDEKRLAIIPYSKGVRILSFSNRQDKLYLYQWSEDGKTDTLEFVLPRSSLSPEETLKYSKEARIKYQNSFEGMTVAPSDHVTIIGNSGLNGIFYEEERIWLLSQTPYYTGYNLLELDLPARKLSSSNFMINDMRTNVNAVADVRRIPYAVISGNSLIIRNSSDYFFEYIIYDLKTKQKVRGYTSGPDESLQKVLHSDYNQRGTWLSGGGQKILENDRAFLRKLSSGIGFINVSEVNKDSITITTGSLKATSGLAGLVLSIGTGLVGSMANLTIGNYQVIPYLTAVRNKLVFSHSRFSTTGFELSAANNITSTLDNLLDNFEKRDLNSNSTFLIKAKEKYLVAVFNSGKKKFEIYSLVNE